MLALGALAAPARLATDASLAIELGETCWMLYERSPSGLAADAVAFDESLEPDGFRPLAEEYPLRPETVESFVYLWRLTRDSVWRERGWRIFEALQVRCRTNSGFASLKGHLREDSMPSYWLAETLKYLFLLFSDDAVLPLDQFVLNTEAHPLRIR
jgi:mannosyl-oligosaccharide alpha-1,2-mannosidase